MGAPSPAQANQPW